MAGIKEMIDAANAVVPRITPEEAQSMIANMRGAMIAQGSDAVTATQRAYASVFGMVQRQAAMMSFNDVFWVLTIPKTDAKAKARQGTSGDALTFSAPPRLVRLCCANL